MKGLDKGLEASRDHDLAIGSSVPSPTTAANICDFGCVTAMRCTGKCQPPPRVRKHCRYCASGHVADASGEHWIVRSVTQARIEVRRCTA